MESNALLNSLDGSNNLETVDDYIDLTSNTNIFDISDLGNLTTVGSFFIGHTQLINLNGLSNLTTIRSLEIQNNTQLSGLLSLSTIL